MSLESELDEREIDELIEFVEAKKRPSRMKTKVLRFLQKAGLCKGSVKRGDGSFTISDSDQIGQFFRNHRTDFPNLRFRVVKHGAYNKTLPEDVFQLYKLVPKTGATDGNAP